MAMRGGLPKKRATQKGLSRAGLPAPTSVTYRQRYPQVLWTGAALAVCGGCV